MQTTQAMAGTVDNPIRLSQQPRIKRVEQWIRDHTVRDGDCKRFTGHCDPGGRPIAYFAGVKMPVRSWLVKNLIDDAEGRDLVGLRAIGCPHRDCLALQHNVALLRESMSPWEKLRDRHETDGEPAPRLRVGGAQEVPTTAEQEAEILRRREQRQPVREIARAMQIGKARVQEVLARHVPEVDSIERERAIRQLHYEGLPIETIGARMGISRKRVASILAGTDTKPALRVPNYGRVPSVFHLASVIA